MLFRLSWYRETLYLRHPIKSIGGVGTGKYTELFDGLDIAIPLLVHSPIVDNFILIVRAFLLLMIYLTFCCGSEIERSSHPELYIHGCLLSWTHDRLIILLYMITCIIRYFRQAGSGCAALN